MIFVTVGTHEQQFNRLLQQLDRLVQQGDITEEVVIQTGYSTYEPQHCTWSKLLPYQKMQQYVAQARIVITHGGPSSFIMPLQIGKIPIVVPRQQQFGEHVNDHQLLFARAVAQRQGNILVVEDISTLGKVLHDYDRLVSAMPVTAQSNNAAFNDALCRLVGQLLPNVP